MDVDVHALVTKLRAYGRHQSVVSLLTNQNNQRVVFAGKAFHDIDERGAYQILQGLLPVLKRTFWPVTDMQKILRKPSTKGVQKKQKKSLTATRDAKKGNATGKKKKFNAGKGRFFGSIQGTQVHQELEDYIQLDEKNFKKKHGDKLHPWTQRILREVLERGWYPLQCEFKVGERQVLRIGTAIDMVCVDTATGDLVFIEFKTGYSGCFETSDGSQMKGCLNFMQNSPLNWASVQITAGVLLLLRRNPQLRLADTASYVIRIDEDDLWVYPIDNAFIRRIEQPLMQALQQSQQTEVTNKQKRKKTKPVTKRVRHVY
jgi:hypothetical protein